MKCTTEKQILKYHFWYFLLSELGLTKYQTVQLKLISFNLRYDPHPAFNGGLRVHNMKNLSIIPEFAVCYMSSEERWKQLTGPA